MRTSYSLHYKSKRTTKVEFNFLTSPNIIFKRSAHKEIGKYVFGTGKRALILHSHSMAGECLRRMTQSLEENGIEAFLHENKSSEPSPDMVDSASDAFKRHDCDFLIAVGGGSVIDTGKAVCGLVTNGGRLEEYLEGVGTGRKIVNAPVPFIAMPTTHGTGAEATKNAVISSREKLYKKSFRDDRLMARKIIVDAELMVSLPKKQTASCSMDALTQLIEAYTCRKATPLTDALCISGLKAAANSILTVYDNGSDVSAREEMAYASLLSGICLANAGLGAVHGFAPALGITYDIPHGESCALLLDHVMRYNISYAECKYAHIGEILTGNKYKSASEAAYAGVDYVSDLKKHMLIQPDLKHLDIADNDIKNIISRLSTNSMGANPVQMSEEQIRDFIISLSR